MPATTERIGFITEKYRLAVMGPDAETVSRFGSLARDMKEPGETLFDSMADVQQACTELHALLSPSRRRFQVPISGEKTAVEMDYRSSLPVARFIDAQRSVNQDTFVVEVGVDFEREQSSLVIWG